MSLPLEGRAAQLIADSIHDKNWHPRKLLDEFKIELRTVDGGDAGIGAIGFQRPCDAVIFVNRRIMDGPLGLAVVAHQVGSLVFGKRRVENRYTDAVAWGVAAILAVPASDVRQIRQGLLSPSDVGTRLDLPFEFLIWRLQLEPLPGEAMCSTQHHARIDAAYEEWVGLLRRVLPTERMGRIAAHRQEAC